METKVPPEQEPANDAEEPESQTSLQNSLEGKGDDSADGTTADRGDADEPNAQGDHEKETVKMETHDKTDLSQEDDVSDESFEELDEDILGEEGVGKGEEEMEDDIGDTEKMDGVERNQLYQRGLEYEAEGEQQRALKCFLGCLKGLKTDTRFTLLPQCLSSIGAIYGELQEYDKAICFKQAEKLYYENALIDANEIQKRLDQMQNSGEEESGVASEELFRAEEYEHLARLLLDKEEPQHALEYAGKATKIRQRALGNDDPLTQQSLNFFASVYAEVGKKQYSDSLRDLADDASLNGMDSSDASTFDSADAEAEAAASSPSSILRNRRTSRSKEKKQVRFDESANREVETESERHLRQQREDYISICCVWLVFIVCAGVLLMMAMYLYCRLRSTEQTCTEFIHDLEAFFRKLKMYYYYYVQPKPSGTTYAS